MMLLLVPLQGRAAEPSRQSLLPSVVTCTLGSASTHFTPGLRDSAAHDVSVETRTAYDSCLSLFGEPVSSARTFEKKARVGQTCELMRTGEPASTRVDWDTGETSTLSLSLYSVSVQGLFTVEVYNGTVTEGKYRGAQAVRTITYVSTDVTGGCLSAQGLTESNGVSNLVLTTL